MQILSIISKKKHVIITYFPLFIHYYALDLDDNLGLSPLGAEDLGLSNPRAPSLAGLSPVGLGVLGANLSRSIALC